ncbi:MAG: RecX family transcriptional regulator [Bacteroidales bacterium]|nr:RecX family transcriptional regulator [Bacteroidales bacterium]
MEEKKCLARLQRLCSRAEYASQDIYRKALKDMEGDGEAAARILSSLVEDRFVDDARYASAFAREKASLQGWGPVKIRFQLRAKGIPDAVIDGALQEIDPEKAGQKLDGVVAGKYRTLKDDPQCRLKLLKFALSRGYEYADVEAAVSRVMKGE